MTLMTFNEVYDRVMPEKKRKEERFNIFAHWIGRPISILMTLPLINSKVKPTTVTKWSIASPVRELHTPERLSHRGVLKFRRTGSGWRPPAIIMMKD